MIINLIGIDFISNLVGCGLCNLYTLLVFGLSFETLIWMGRTGVLAAVFPLFVIEGKVEELSLDVAEFELEFPLADFPLWFPFCALVGLEFHLVYMLLPGPAVFARLNWGAGPPFLPPMWFRLSVPPDVAESEVSKERLTTTLYQIYWEPFVDYFQIQYLFLIKTMNVVHQTLI